MIVKPIYCSSATQISTVPCHIRGIIVDNSESNVITVVVYNESDTSKTASKTVLPIHALTKETKVIMFPDPGMKCSEGCYVYFTGSVKVVILVGDL